MINVSDFALYDECVFVMWKWEWGENVYELNDPSSPVSDSEDVNDIPHQLSLILPVKMNQTLTLPTPLY